MNPHSGGWRACYLLSSRSYTFPRRSASCWSTSSPVYSPMSSFFLAGSYKQTLSKYRRMPRRQPACERPALTIRNAPQPAMEDNPTATRLCCLSRRPMFLQTSFPAGGPSPKAAHWQPLQTSGSHSRAAGAHPCSTPPLDEHLTHLPHLPNSARSLPAAQHGHNLEWQPLVHTQPGK